MQQHEHSQAQREPVARVQHHVLLGVELRLLLSLEKSDELTDATLRVDNARRCGRASQSSRADGLSQRLQRTCMDAHPSSSSMGFLSAILIDTATGGVK